MYRCTLILSAALMLLGLMLVSQPAWSQAQPTVAAETDLQKKLKALEQEAIKIRQAMLKEVDVEAKKAEEALKKAQEDMDKAKKANDKAAEAKAKEAVAKAKATQVELGRVRTDIERRLNVGVTTAAKGKPVPEEDRLGIKASVPGTTLIAQLGLTKEQGNVGMVLDKVMKESPAAKAGLQVNDVLVQLDGKPVPSDLVKYKKLLTEIKPGTPVEAVVVRKAKQETVKGLTIPPAE